MQLGRARLSAEEQQHRLRSGLSCSERGCRRDHCPRLPVLSEGARSRNLQAGSTTSAGESTSRSQLLGTLLLPHASVSVSVLVDSGADDKFIDTSLAKTHNVPTVALAAPKRVLAIDGSLTETITHKTEPLRLRVSGNHFELLDFFVIDSPATQVVVGLPWLKAHNPHVDWRTSTVRS